MNDKYHTGEQIIRKKNAMNTIEPIRNAEDFDETYTYEIVAYYNLEHPDLIKNVTRGFLPFNLVSVKYVGVELPNLDDVDLRIHSSVEYARVMEITLGTKFTDEEFSNLFQTFSRIDKEHFAAKLKKTTKHNRKKTVNASITVHFE